VLLKGSNMQPQVSTQFASIFVLVLTAFGILIAALFIALTVVAFCKMTAKAGYSWALGLVAIVPFGNIILPLYLAFADWPVHKELRQLRQRCGGMPA
jgi:hypothetical protein